MFCLEPSGTDRESDDESDEANDQSDSQQIRDTGSTDIDRSDSSSDIDRPGRGSTDIDSGWADAVDEYNAEAARDLSPFTPAGNVNPQNRKLNRIHLSISTE